MPKPIRVVSGAAIYVALSVVVVNILVRGVSYEHGVVAMVWLLFAAPAWACATLSYWLVGRAEDRIKAAKVTPTFLCVGAAILAIKVGWVWLEVIVLPMHSEAMNAF